MKNLLVYQKTNFNLSTQQNKHIISFLFNQPPGFRIIHVLQIA